MAFWAVALCCLETLQLITLSGACCLFSSGLYPPEVEAGRSQTVAASASRGFLFPRANRLSVGSKVQSTRQLPRWEAMGQEVKREGGLRGAHTQIQKYGENGHIGDPSDSLHVQNICTRIFGGSITKGSPGESVLTAGGLGAEKKATSWLPSRSNPLLAREGGLFKTVT